MAMVSPRCWNGAGRMRSAARGSAHIHAALIHARAGKRSCTSALVSVGIQPGVVRARGGGGARVRDRRQHEGVGLAG